MTRSLSATMIACGLATALAGAACSDRGETAVERNDNTAQSAGRNENTAQSAGTAGSDRSDRNPVTVTGCFQEASGFNNFVLTNTTGSGSSPEQRAQGYRIERGGDIDQHVGKQVKVTGWTERDNTASMSGIRTDQDQGAQNQTRSSKPGDSTRQSSDRSAQDAGDRDFNDFAELHVEKIESVGQNCGNASSGASPRGNTSGATHK